MSDINVAEQMIRQEKLGSIARKDNSLADRLCSYPDITNKDLVYIDEELDKPYVVEKPKKLKLNTTGVSLDYTKSLRLNYNSDDTGSEEVGQIVVAGYGINVDISVKSIIKALLETGVTQDIKLASAVRSLFREVLGFLCNSRSNVISVDEMCDFLDAYETKDKYQIKLVDTMLDILSA